MCGRGGYDRVLFKIIGDGRADAELKTAGASTEPEGITGRGADRKPSQVCGDGSTYTYYVTVASRAFPSVWGWKSKWGIKHQAIGQNWMDFLKNIQ